MATKAELKLDKTPVFFIKSILDLIPKHVCDLATFSVWARELCGCIRSASPVTEFV